VLHDNFKSMVLFSFQKFFFVAVSSGLLLRPICLFWLRRGARLLFYVIHVLRVSLFRTGMVPSVPGEAPPGQFVVSPSFFFKFRGALPFSGRSAPKCLFSRLFCFLVDFAKGPPQTL